MFLIIFRTIFVVVGGSVGFYFLDFFGKDYLKGNLLLLGQVVGFVVLGIVGYFAGGAVGKKVINDINIVGKSVKKIPGNNIVVGVIGLFLSLIIALLVSITLKPIPFIGVFLPILIVVIFSYVGIIFALKNKKIIVSLLRMDRRKRQESSLEVSAEDDGEYYGKARPKILDTSCIIDGRISDIAGTGFIEGKFIIPGFVVNELQDIADSEDNIKRTRGRTGLDVLQKIQDNKKIDAQIIEKEYRNIKSVDSKLIELSKELNGVIVTTDFNLNKVAKLKGTEVLNINDLSTAVKMVVLPGEKMTVEIVKEGKEKDQGIAYLSDGTMIVVEGGRDLVGEDVDVYITGILQTSAGRMVFSKISDDDD